MKEIRFWNIMKALTLESDKSPYLLNADILSKRKSFYLIVNSS